MSTSPPSPPADAHGYEPPGSLWQMVEQYVPGHEQDEMKNMLGEFLVEQSIELHQEVETLLEIWREYRAGTANILPRNRLPEPPNARDRLKQEICFFVQNIREKARENGRSSKAIFSRHNSEVLEYALDKKRPGTGQGSRPATGHSQQNGRETPRMVATPNSDRLSLVSTLSDDVESMSDKLNMLHVEEVAQHLRQTLEDEVSQLLTDINFLQSCLDEEVDFRCESSMDREPTLTDLRETRTKLEKELLSEPATPNVLVDSPVRRLSQGLKPASGKLRPPHACTATSSMPDSSKRPAPLKASHQLAVNNLTLQPPSDSGGVERKVLKERQRKARQDLKMDSSDLGHLCREQPSHLQIRTASAEHSASNTRLVMVGHIPNVAVGEDSGSTEDARHLVPSPPSSAKPAGVQRPTSANRFRRMVVQCRDGT